MIDSDNDEPAGEPADVGASIWADRLVDEVEKARAYGIESHTRIVDTDKTEHAVELAGDVEKVEHEGHHVLVWLRNAGIITVSGAAVVGAIAIIRHRMKAKD